MLGLEQISARNVPSVSARFSSQAHFLKERGVETRICGDLIINGEKYSLNTICNLHFYWAERKLWENNLNHSTRSGWDSVNVLPSSPKCALLCICDYNSAGSSLVFYWSVLAQHQGFLCFSSCLSSEQSHGGKELPGDTAGTEDPNWPCNIMVGGKDWRAALAEVAIPWRLAGHQSAGGRLWMIVDCVCITFLKTSLSY